MSKKRLDAIAIVGEYTDSQGQTKKRFSKLGSAFIDDKGQVSIKLDSMPCGGTWDGWISLKEPYDQDKPAARQSSEPARGSRRGSAADIGDQDIPF